MENRQREEEKKERKNLFKRFFRLDESHSGGKGYGLGLSIAKEIVTMHKGEIKVESEKKYIHFIVLLPWIR
ncbi:ATP-binding protein [Oribacterium parvum]|uniref:sensor histidine kinase n=1 Tax=Oribacterium parvum TaxID=1501329 RepID=UPI0028DCCED0|nr:ATP-binding protein [Oribacterium parvum]